jgi:carbon-monoxide dehydrogenase iron sulfur subunit
MLRMVSVDAERCDGCRLCELTCSLQKLAEFDPKSARIQVRFEPEGKCVPLVCTQCKDAWCIEACPSAAIARDPLSGIVRISDGECVLCGDCVSACPYGAVRWPREDEPPVKCDDCGGEPACVPICPVGALAYATLEVRG